MSMQPFLVSAVGVNVDRGTSGGRPARGGHVPRVLACQGPLRSAPGRPHRAAGGVSSALAAVVALLACAVPPAPAQLPEIKPIERRLPPPGIELSPAQRAEVAAARDHIAERLVEIGSDDLRRADLGVLHKAVSYALEFGEFYKPADVAVVGDLVRAADERAAESAAGVPEAELRGLRVCGYRSSVDGSLQPYGLEVPDGLDLARPVPLWVWLHGRGDRVTDLHFIAQRLERGGEVPTEDAIVLHPFGRQCIGWKSAGEVDVFEAIDDVARRYDIDRDRIALLGFSMGGAGAWHIGAHYADRFAALHAGAGFAETARYLRLAPADFPPPHEQVLWGLYDVPGYVRNLFNLPVVAYSGELDKQIQAARVMEEAFAAHGRRLEHVIGAGMGHKYDPASRARIGAFVAGAVARGRDRTPREVFLQTRTLRYSRVHWVAATRLHRHWHDSRIDARLSAAGAVDVTTRNVAAFTLDPGEPLREVRVDGTLVGDLPPGGAVAMVDRGGGRWQVGAPGGGEGAKRPGLQGPIDDAFLEPFLVALPVRASGHPLVQRWIEFELAHFEQRWRATFRGELRKKPADEVTAADQQRFHVIAFGDPATNPLVARAVGAWDDIAWDRDVLRFAGHELDAARHMAVVVRPNPASPGRYLVLNSGPTFREAHDRTNSLQNPKLPDWALVDLGVDPDAHAPGRVVAAGFFDERWQLAPVQ